MISNKKLDKLVKCMKEIAQLPFDYAENYEAVYQLLAELKERRDSDLRPATALIQRSSSMDQLNKIDEEWTEFREAYFNYCTDRTAENRRSFIEEGVDLQTVVKSTFAKEGVTNAEEMDGRRRVIAKNEARGYYDVR